jgi:hypothetical protein
MTSVIVPRLGTSGEMNSCEHRNELLDSMKWGEFLAFLGN